MCKVSGSLGTSWAKSSQFGAQRLFGGFQNNHLTTHWLMEYLEEVAAEENRKANSNNDLLLTDGRSE